MSKKPSKKDKSDSSKKSKKNVQNVVDDPEPWINELKTLTINDDAWQCHVSMVVETNPYNMEYIKTVNSLFFSDKNFRHRIKIITDSSLSTDILESSYNLDINQCSDACKKLYQTVLNYCSSDGFSSDLPVSLLASLIKYHLYNYKLKNSAEARVIKEYNKKKQEAKEESLLAIQNIVKKEPIKSKQTSEKKSKEQKTVASNKSAKSLKTPVVKFTDLRKREEEVLDKISKETDEPQGGPNLYIVLTSFRQIELPLELLKLQIPLISIIKLHNFCIPPENHMISDETNAVLSRGLSSNTYKSKLEQMRFSNPQDLIRSDGSKLDAFWHDFLTVLSNKDNTLLFKDTIFLKFFPKLYDQLELRKKQTAAAAAAFHKIKQSFCDQFCYLQYDIQDVKRQHINYINHLIIHDVTEKHFYDRDNLINLYTTIVESVPPQIISLPFILDSIILQVEQLVEPNSSLTSEFNTRMSKNESEQTGTLLLKLKQLDEKYDLISEDNSLKNKDPPLPDMFVYGDEIGIKANWQDRFNYVKSTTCNVLKCFWENFVKKHLPAYDDISCEIQGTDDSLYCMLKNTTNVTVLDKLCNIPCSFDSETLFVEDKASVFCSDSETDVTVYKKSICNLRQYYPAVEATGLKHFNNSSEGYYTGQIYDQHSFCFEEMTSDIMLQNLFTSLQSFSCVDLIQDYFNDSFFVKFHHKRNCCKKEYLMGTLRTKTALRDYYDYTIEEEFYWLNEQELLYNRLKSKEERFKILKALEWIQYLKNKEANRTEKTCSEKNFILRNTLKNNPSQPNVLSPVDSYTEEELQKKISSMIDDSENLEAFDIDLPNRVQFSEKRQEFIISKNAKLQVKWLSTLYKDEATSLEINIHGHCLYFYQPAEKNNNDNFHLIHQSGMVFHFKKNTISTDLQTDAYKHSEFTNYNKSSMEPEIGKDEMTDIFLKPLIFQLEFSLPTTLYFELINPSDTPLYVKQHYLTDISLPSNIKTERYRCYLMDGTLIKFMKDETIIIYYSNSEIFVCQTLPKIIPEESRQTESSTESKTKTPNPAQQQPPKNKKAELQNNKSTLVEPPAPVLPAKQNAHIKSYERTSPSGRRVSVANGKTAELEPLFCITRTDIFNGVIVTERSDGTVLTYNQFGTLFVDFPDGSRITSSACFADDEVVFDVDEDGFEEGSTNVNENIQTEPESEQLTEEELSGSMNLNLGQNSESFLVVNIQHVFEHPNFASVIVDPNSEIVNFNLPNNVNISLSSEGLYNINFGKDAEIRTEIDKIIFREINSENLPEFIINLSDEINNTHEKQKRNTADENVQYAENSISPNAVNYIGKNVEDENITLANDVDKDAVSNSEVKEANIMLHCADENRSTLTIDRFGDIKIEGTEYICKCTEINDGRYFVLNTQFSGLQVFPPTMLELCAVEAANIKNSVTQYFGTTDHNVLLVLEPLLTGEYEKWLIPFSGSKIHPLYTLPSTYNDKNTSFNPFPKTKNTNKEPKENMPPAFLIRSINRVNCNIHLEKETFLENKKIVDYLRLNKCSHLLIQLYNKGDMPYCKADKAVIDYIRDYIIGSLVSRVRSRVVKRLEMRKTEEYMEILTKRILLPYFESAEGAVHIILQDVLLDVISENPIERNNLEKLFTKQLCSLTDEELNDMHDKIAQLTVSKFCDCDEKGEFCQLKILLKAGRTLHNIFPNMMTVLFSFNNILKKKKEVEMNNKKKRDDLVYLLNMPSDELTETNILSVHNMLKSMTNISLCSCDQRTIFCKLKAVLLAGAMLNYIFPNLNAVLQAYSIDINF